MHGLLTIQTSEQGKQPYKQRLKQIPLEGQSLPCTYLAHHELKVLSLLLLFFNIVIIVILIYQY